MDSTCHSSILYLLILLIFFPSNPINGIENINSVVDSGNTEVVVDEIGSEIDTKFNTTINETTLKVNETMSTTTSIGIGTKTPIANETIPITTSIDNENKTSTEIRTTPLPNEIISIEKQKEIKKQVGLIDYYEHETTTADYYKQSLYETTTFLYETTTVSDEYDSPTTGETGSEANPSSSTPSLASSSVSTAVPYPYSTTRSYWRVSKAIPPVTRPGSSNGRCPRMQTIVRDMNMIESFMQNFESYPNVYPNIFNSNISYSNDSISNVSNSNILESFHEFKLIVRRYSKIIYSITTLNES